MRFRDSLIPLAVFIPVKRTSKTSETFKSLLLSLCISDLGVGFLIQPLYVAYLTMEITKNSKKTDNIIAFWAVVKAYAIPHSLFVFASFFGVFAITVDRFLAIHLHNLRYHKLLSYTLYGGYVVRVLAHFFFTAAHFHLALVAASISYFLTAATKLSCCSCTKKKVFFVVYLSL